MKEVSVRNKFGWALKATTIETFLQSVIVSQICSSMQDADLPISLWRICALYTEL